MMQLSQLQNKVLGNVKSFLKSDASIFILRGYAGTGKTTMIKEVADYVATFAHPLLLAPTGRAARVLSEKTGRTASTIHRAIYQHEITGTRSQDGDSDFVIQFSIVQAEGRVIAIVDEASMVSSRTEEHEVFRFGTGNLLDDLLTFVRPSFGGKVIFVGDPCQLPPVGDNVSNALRTDYFTKKGLAVYEDELTEVFRQKGGNIILENAIKIRDLLKQDKRNSLVLEEREKEIESVPVATLLQKYLECKKESQTQDAIIICYSNKSANLYNKEIREHLYGGNVSIREGDVLVVAQNNYLLELMNGEFVKVLSVKSRHHESAPIYTQVGAEKQRIVLTMNFVQVEIEDKNGERAECWLLEDFLTDGHSSLSIDMMKALWVNFKMRESELKEGTVAFAQTLSSDSYYNALRAKYGYAVTCHKSQGGEWEKVFVDFTGRTGLDDDCLRWSYTAITRASECVYMSNPPHITPFSKFQIKPIGLCQRIDSEFRCLKPIKETEFHSTSTDNFLRAKFNGIVNNLVDTPYRILRVESKPYLEIYQIQTPDSVERFDLYYKAGGLFSPAKAMSKSKYTQDILSLLDDESQLPIVVEYSPSDEIHAKIYNLMYSVCDELSVQVTNVVEHKDKYYVVYYMRTSGTYSYIKIYVNGSGFITYAQPMSLKGDEDKELSQVIAEINNRLV